MSNSQLYQKWFRRYIKAIHRLDQCQAMADDLASQGHPKAANFRKLQDVYAFFVRIAEEQVARYKTASRKK